MSESEHDSVYCIYCRYTTTLHPDDRAWSVYGVWYVACGGCGKLIPF